MCGLVGEGDSSSAAGGVPCWTGVAWVVEHGRLVEVGPGDSMGVPHTTVGEGVSAWSSVCMWLSVCVAQQVAEGWIVAALSGRWLLVAPCVYYFLVEAHPGGL